MRAAALAFLGLTACDLVSGLDDFVVAAPPPSLVGNGIIDDGEGCDDGNAAAGDGCDAAGQAELGWGCPEPGEPCLRVSGFALGAQSLLMPPFGGMGGTAYDEACAGPSGLLVGFEGNTGSDFLGSTLGICMPFVVGEDAGLDYAPDADQELLPAHGDDTSGSRSDTLCAVGEVVVGMSGFGDAELHGMSLACARITFLGGAWGWADETYLPLHGSMTGTLLPPKVCAANQAVAGYQMRAGGHIDALSLACHELVPTYCGDGTVDYPFETCDSDQNCDELCQTL